MNNVLSHPRQETLVAYGLGTLDEAQSAEIEQHLEDCSECVQRLEALPEDSFVDKLRSTHDREVRESMTLDSNAEEPERAIMDTGEIDGATLVEIPVDLRDHARYQLTDRIGVGGMGIVFRARHRLMNRDVALKMINDELLKRPGVIERFGREVQAAAQLSHPNIVTSYDAEHAGDCHFLAMEYIDGRTLAEVVRDDGPLPVQEALHYIREAARGLQYAHEAGLIHRDVKPHNLMLTGDGGVKILDFGLASLIGAQRDADDDQARADAPRIDAVSDATGLTQTGTVLGTVDYLAPEQCDDSRSVDARADIYSMGCTLYFLLAGRPPFSGTTIREKLMAHRHDRPVPICELRADVPPEVEQLLERMMAKEPETRHQTATEIIEAINQVLPETSARAVKRPVWAWLVASAASLLFIAAAAVLYLKTNNGVVEVESLDPNVTVIVEQNDQQVAVLGKGHNNAITLDVGRYTAAVGEGEQQYELDMPADRAFELKRGDKIVLRVRRKPAGSPGAAIHNLEVAGVLPLHRDRILQILSSANGQRVVMVGYDGDIQVWDMTSGKLMTRLSGPPRIGSNHVALSADGELVAIGLLHGVQIWNLNEPDSPKHIPVESIDRVMATAFSPERKHLLVAGRNSHAPHPPAIVFSLDTGNEVSRFATHEAAIQTCEFTPHGQCLTGGFDSTIRLWDPNSGEEIRDFEGLNSHVRGMAVSPDGRWVAAVGYPHHFVVWDLDTGKLLREFRGHTGKVTSISFSPDSSKIVSGGYDKTLRIWDVVSGRLLARAVVECRTTNLVRAIPNSPFVLTGGGWDDKAGDGDYGVYVWRVPESLVSWPAPTSSPPRVTQEAASQPRAVPHREIASIILSRKLEGHTGPVRDLALFPGDDRLASCSMDGTVRIWDVATGRELWSYKVPESPDGAGSVAVSPDGSLVAVGDFVGFVVMLDAKSHEVLWRVRAHPRRVADLEFHPHEPIFASSSCTAHSLIRFWQVNSGAEVGREHEMVGGEDIDFSSKGQMIAAGSRPVRVYDVASGSRLHSWPPYNESTFCVEFHPQDEFVACGRRKGGIDLRALTSRYATGGGIRAHASGVLDLAFASNGRYLISGSRDATLVVWNVRDKQPIGRLESDTHRFNRLELAANDKQLFTAGGWEVVASPPYEIVPDDDFGIYIWELEFQLAPDHFWQEERHPAHDKHHVHSPQDGKGQE